MQCCSIRTVHFQALRAAHISTTRGHPSTYHIDTKGESILCAKIGYIWPCTWSAKTVPQTIPTVIPGAPALTTGTNYGAERSIWGSHKSGRCPSAVTKVQQTPPYRIPSLFPSTTRWCPLVMESYTVVRHWKCIGVFFFNFPWFTQNLVSGRSRICKQTTQHTRGRSILPFSVSGFKYFWYNSLVKA